MIVKVEKIVHQGYGLARTEDGVLFAAGVMPGEILEVKKVERRRGARFAVDYEIVEPSPDRKESFCRYFGRCGGCQWQFAPYQIQLAWKGQILTETLERIAGIEAGIDRTIAGQDVAYRRRMRFHVQNGQAGFYRQGTKDVGPVSSCPIFCRRGNQLLTVFHEVYRACPDTDFSRMLSSFEIRVTSDDRDSGLLFISPSGNGSKAFTRYFTEKEEEINLWLSLSRTELPGSGFRTLAGKEYLQDSGFIVSPLSFYQPNLKLALEVYDAVAELISGMGIKRIIDIYCGIGLLETRLSSEMEILGIEANSFAVKDARVNAFLNERNADFLIMDASEVEELKEAELAVVNPPRTGIHENLISALNNSPDISRVIYLSCDPASFARDVSRLKRGGFSLSRLWLADYYPHTYHFETVALLERG